MLQERRLKIQIKISVQAVGAKSEENSLFMLSLH
jgi:hypothetical protein